MVNVIGLGYIGLPTALMLASHGVEVVGTDYNKELVATLNEGKTTFEEKGLKELYDSAVKAGIKFSTEYQKTNVYIISVPTPYDKITKKIDCVYVESAVKTVLNYCSDDAIIVIESTVSPGTIHKFIKPIVDAKNKDFLTNISLVHAPERIIPGNMIHELLHNNRTIGADNIKIGQRIKDIYSTFCQGEIVLTDIKSAEMTKVVENTFRAVNIAFANELAKICQKDGLDVYEIINICNKHPRVNILQPGPGVGGHCISVDPWFLVGDYPELTNVIRNSMEINESMPSFVFEKIIKILNEKNIDIRRVGVYGLTYKENVDDTRESPALQLNDVLINNNVHSIKFYDPWVKTTIVENQYFDFEQFINDIDLVVVLVKHSHLKENMKTIKQKVVFDTVNIVEKGDNVYKL